MSSNSLSSIIGQETAVASVRRALAAGSLPGAYLFVGAAGVGKGALARALAQAATCLSPQVDPYDSCGVCDSCKLLIRGTHPEVQVFYPAGEATQIWQFWERDNKPESGALTRTLSYAPVIGRKRVYIIERAETLTDSAANSLLKVLEEPPAYAFFILLAPNASRVLPTIVSRSQMVRLNASSRAALEKHLVESVGVEPARAALLAAYCEGRTGLATRMAEAPAVGEEISRAMDFALLIPEAPQVRALKLAEQMRKLASQTKALVGEEVGADATADSDSATVTKEKTSRRQLAAVFELLVAFYRDLMAYSVGGSAVDGVINRDRAAELQRLGQVGGPQRWIRCLDALTIARRRLDANANVALVTETLCMVLVS